jgi:hypothetical protein
VKTAVAIVTVNVLPKVWAPLVFPVITMFWAPVAIEGTVMVPDRLPLAFTDRVKVVAPTPPMVALEIVSEGIHPVPDTVILVPIGPEAGVKVAVRAVTVKALLNV